MAINIRSSAALLLILLAPACQTDNGGKSGTGKDGGGGGASGGSGWTKVYDAGLDGPGESITIDGNYILVGMAKGVVVSNDDGATWTRHTTGLPDSPVVTLLALDDRVLAGLIGAPILFVSKDHGSTWTQSDTGLPQTQDAYALFKTSSAVLLGLSYGSSDPGAEGGIFRSSDKGATWTKSSTGLPQMAGASAFSSIGSTLFASAQANLATSTDDGQTWKTQALTGGNPLGEATVGAALFVSTSAGVSLDSAVSKSTDQGATWTDAGSGLPTKDPADVLFATGSDLYATAFAQGDNGIYRSTDSGASWQAYNDNLDILGTGIAPRIVAMAAHGKYLFAVEDAGNVWRHDL